MPMKGNSPSTREVSQDEQIKELLALMRNRLEKQSVQIASLQQQLTEQSVRLDHMTSELADLKQLKSSSEPQGIIAREFSNINRPKLSGQGWTIDTSGIKIFEPPVDAKSLKQRAEVTEKLMQKQLSERDTVFQSGETIELQYRDVFNGEFCSKEIPMERFNKMEEYSNVFKKNPSAVISIKDRDQINLRDLQVLGIMLNREVGIAVRTAKVEKYASPVACLFVSDSNTASLSANVGAAISLPKEDTQYKYSCFVHFHPTRSTDKVQLVKDMNKADEDKIEIVINAEEGIFAYSYGEYYNERNQSKLLSTLDPRKSQPHPEKPGQSYIRRIYWYEDIITGRTQERLKYSPSQGNQETTTDSEESEEDVCFSLFEDPTSFENMVEPKSFG